MKKLLFAISAATLLVAGPAAFANPSEEALGDYAGWRDATRAGIVGFGHETYDKNGLVVPTPNNLRR
jgi:hypothetical protein